MSHSISLTNVSNSYKIMLYESYKPNRNNLMMYFASMYFSCFFSGLLNCIFKNVSFLKVLMSATKHSKAIACFPLKNLLSDVYID